MAFARAAARRLLGGRAKFTARSATSASRDLTGSAVHHQDLQPPVHGHSRNSRLENGVVRLDKMERSTPSRHMCTMPELPSEKSSTVTGMITVAELKELARTKTIDTVVVGLTDCYGRLVGKRYTADFFLESAVDDGTHACSYLLATDMDMEPVPGLEKTALVLCDVVQDDHELAPHAPRSILRNQIKAAQAVGKFTPMAASELEYFLYKDTYEESKNRGYHNLKPAGWVREDYHIFQGTRGEYFHGPARRHLEASGVPVENSKGEFGLGQHELNVKYAEVLEMADRHSVYKQCLKELADSMGVSVTFMAKPDAAQPGSSCHIHLSLWENGRNIFAGNQTLGSTKCSDEFRWFLGGWMHYTPELMCFYAPNVNSYKRYVSGSWAPTQIAWSRDNRTAPFRVLGSGKSLRIECRLPGADCNVYLAFAAALASGMDGIRNKIEPPPQLEGNVYFAKDLLTIPQSLGAATAAFKDSKFAKEMLGEDVHHHYHHFFDNELLAYQQAVTDWEKARYFEQI
uniref:GS catalytic domain-containing protein n=1 Tax=Physcomitrium patens TaxID=3218 RepID=A0A7I4FDI5_PHYPA